MNKESTGLNRVDPSILPTLSLRSSLVRLVRRCAAFMFLSLVLELDEDKESSRNLSIESN